MNFKKKTCRALVSASSIALGIWAGAASAQTSPATDGVQQEDNVADIVVTANKREQRLNDVGLTVSVLSAENLKTRQISSLADIAASIPSLSYTNSANGTPILTLRGVGFADSSLGAAPTVSTYVDEAPLPYPALTKHSAFDLERIEVLKGPQGTLFGQNSTGGAINYVTAKPTDHLAAGIDLSYGRFNAINGEAFISGPLTDTIRARLVGRIERADGWQISQSRPDDRNGAVRNYMGRVIVEFEPSDSLRFSLNANGWIEKGQTQSPQFVGVQPQNPILSPLLIASPFTPQTPRASDWTPGLPFKDNSFWQTVLRGDLDITDSLTLTSLTSYSDFKQRQGDDGDGLPLSLQDLPLNRGRIKSFAQEVRLSNGSKAAFRWVFGGNYSHSRIDQLVDLDIRDSSSNETLGIALGYPISSAFYSSFQTAESYAAFGNAEYDIGDTLTLKAGARYTKSINVAKLCNADTSGLPTNVGSFFYDVLYGGAFGTYPTGACFPTNDLGVVNNGVAPGTPGQFKGRLSEDNVSWRAGVDWKPRPGMLLYANLAKGYKTGGFPALSSNSFSQYIPVKQESVMSYETGFKATLIDRTLQFNGAAFYYDYTNKQLRSKVVVVPFGALDVLQNIPKSTIKGFELELNATPTRGLTVNTAFTYVNAKIDQFVGINAAGLAADFAGSSVPYTPKFQIGTNIDYKFALTDSLSGFIGASINFRSDSIAVIGGNVNIPSAYPQGKPLFKIDDYTLIDGQIGVEGPDGKWRASIWGKNIFNKYYWNNTVAAYDVVARYAGMPATYGLSFSFKY
jgi:iron complex outermembrane receptor protein